MKLVVGRDALLGALSRAVGVVDRRTTIPILACAHLTAKAGSLQVRATDMDMQVCVDVGCSSEAGGVLAVEASLLHDALKALPAGGEVILEGMDTGRLSVRCGRSNFRIPYLPADAFPSLPEDRLEAAGAVPAAELSAGLKGVIHAASRNEARFILNGVLLEAAPTGLRFVATDGKQLALCDRPANVPSLPPIILPFRAATQIQRTFTEGAVAMKTNGRLLHLSSEGVSLTAKLIEGGFPPYALALAKPREQTLTVETRTFTNLLRRALVVAHDSDRTVRLKIAPGLISMLAHHINRGDTEDQIEAAYEGPEARLSAPADQLVSALEQSGAEMVELQFGGESPILVRPVAAESPAFLVATLSRAG